MVLKFPLKRFFVVFANHAPPLGCGVVIGYA